MKNASRHLFDVAFVSTFVCFNRVFFLPRTRQYYLFSTADKYKQVLPLLDIGSLLENTNNHLTHFRHSNPIANGVKAHEVEKDQSLLAH